MSTWDIYSDLKGFHSEQELYAKMKTHFGDGYFVLNTPDKEIYGAVLKDPDYFMLEKGSKALKSDNTAYFHYEVWPTDHPFTNKRVALMKMVLSFLEKDR